MAEDLEVLNEVFGGHGFLNSLSEADYYADAFEDARLNEAYAIISDKMSEIHRIYAELRAVAE